MDGVGSIKCILPARQNLLEVDGGDETGREREEGRRKYSLMWRCDGKCVGDDEKVEC